jgi:hypothetical protein
MIDVNHHVPEGLLETGQNNSEVVHNDRYTAPVNREEVVDIAKEPACRLDFSQKSRDMIIVLELRRASNAEQLRSNTIAPYGLPPTPFNRIHPYADIKSMRPWKQHRALMFWGA